MWSCDGCGLWVVALICVRMARVVLSLLLFVRSSYPDDFLHAFFPSAIASCGRVCCLLSAKQRGWWQCWQTCSLDQWLRGTGQLPLQSPTDSVSAAGMASVPDSLLSLTESVLPRLTNAEGESMDVRPVSALTSIELVHSMARAAQRLFHHVDPTVQQQQQQLQVGQERRGKRKRAVPDNAPSLNQGSARRWRRHARDEEFETLEAQQTCAFHLPSFLHSPASPALVHRFASQPSATAAALPRFLACVSSLTAVLTAQSARLRTAPPPLVDRLPLTSHSLSSLASQHESVSAALRLCRDRLRTEVEDDRAVASGEEWFVHIHRLLQRLRRQLRLVSDEELEAADRAVLLPDAGGATETTVHLASAGVVSCFVIEIKLRRRERSAVQRHSEFEQRRKEAAAAGASLSPPPLHDCIVSVKADFLQGDAELHDPQIDCDLYALLAQCRFAALQRKLSHALSMEAVADKYPTTPLDSRRADVVAAFNEHRESSKLPCVVTNAVDGPQLAFQHVHTADQHGDDEQLSLSQLAFSPHSTRLCFASHPAHSFTHSLTYIGVEEHHSVQQQQQQQHASTVTAASTSSPSSSLSSPSAPSFLYVLSLTPAVVVPSSTLRSIALLAAGDSSQRGQSAAVQMHSQHQQQPALAYHDYVAGTSPAAALRLSARVAITSTVQLYQLTNDSTLIEEACVVSYIPVASMRALPAIVRTLRQHIAFNQLYASCFRHPRTTRDTAAATDGSAVTVDVTAFPPHTLRLRIGLPATPNAAPNAAPASAQFIALDIRLTAGEPHEACTALIVQQSATATSVPSAACFDCHAWSVQLERSFDSPAPCSDSFALQVLCRTESVPALVHAVVSRAKKRGVHDNTNGHSRPAG